MKRALLALLALFFLGCSAKIEYVYLPQKCLIPLPSKPRKVSKFEDNLRNLLIYAKELEEGLRFCTQEIPSPLLHPP